ncbi:hypothetical protein [Leifsonia sp. NPDC058248]|uniref:hypothetical protein n=1 Tax=Leifsonia sp. NPDC058248 TaxID=3346402 RepID=UPI0036D7F4C2
MSYADAFDVVDAGEGRWDIQLHETLLVAGQVWRTATGYLLSDWADRQLGTFPTLGEAVRTLWVFESAGRPS